MIESPKPTVARRVAKFVLLVFALGLPVVLYGMFACMTRMRNDVAQWLPSTYPETRQFIRFIQHFDPEAFVLVSWDGCTLDDPRVGRLAAGLVGAPSLEPEHSKSQNYSKVITGASLLETLMSPPINLTRDQALARLRGSLVGDDLDMTCVVFSMTPFGVEHMRAALRELYDVAQRDCGLMPADLKLGGPPVDNVALDEAGEASMLKVLGYTTFFGLIVCWWCLRHPLLIAIVLSAGLYTVAATQTVFYFTGGELNAIVMTMNSLVYVTAVSGAIHLANYYRELAPVVGPDRAPWQAVRHAALPLFLATFTTAVGLLSLAYSDLVPIRTLGIYSAVGVFIGLACMLGIVTSVLQLWPIEIRRPRAATPSAIDWSALPWFATRRPLLVSAIALALCGMAVWGFTRVVTSVQIMRLFSPDAKILRDYAWLEEHLGPLVPVEVIVRYGPECKLDFRERIELVERIQDRVNALPNVGSSLSAATFSPDSSALPRSGPQTFRNTVHKVRLKRHRADFERSGFLRYDEGDELWRITARVDALADVDYSRFKREIDAAVAPLLKQLDDKQVTGVQLSYTGVLPIVYQAQNSLLDGMIIGYGTDVALLAVAMVVVARSASAGLLLVLPSLLPALLAFGAMGWLGIVVDMGIVMPPSVALGVTVDDVMHFLLRVRDSIRAGHSRREAVMEAYEHCGRAMYQSWAILGLGILSFTFSPFVPTRHFGYMMMALLTIGLAGNMLLLPALLAGPLGALWERTIRRREARQAALALPRLAISPATGAGAHADVVAASSG